MLKDDWLVTSEAFPSSEWCYKAYELIAKHALLFELRFCDLRIAPVTKHLLV